MKISRIAGAFKPSKLLTVHTAVDGEQWIGNGRAFYSLRGMPPLSPAVVLTFFDIPPSKQDKWTLGEEGLPSYVNFSDNARGDRALDECTLSVNWNGNTFILMTCDNSIYAVDVNYLKPLFDDPDYLYFFARRAESGDVVIVAKVALEVKAVIIPAQPQRHEAFNMALARVYNKFRLAAMQEGAAAAELGDGVYMVNKGTGEILGTEV